MPGALLAIEGIDGAGKTTLAAHLAATLRAEGHRVLLEKEPTDGPHGRTLRASARTGRLPVDEELALFVADRRAHVATVIAPALAAGDIVIVDRYVASSVAYQGSRGVAVEDVLAANAFAPVPALTLLLDVPPSVGVGRVRARDTAENAFEREADLARCRTIFLALAGAPGVVVLDASRGPDVVYADALAHVRATLAEGAR